MCIRDSLNGLQSRVCRPLDKPLIPLVDGEADAEADDLDVSADEGSPLHA